ncbi:MAG: DivIVA domain-containing protein [Nocardiopsaceae bacterium]|nr:DivIVA domain-containing protein [Nocardiopsaceae bacterium]
MPLTPTDVRNKQFSTTRLRPGYDEEEVDAFLDEVEAELDRLIQENGELRGKLAEVLRGGGKPEVPALSSPLSEHQDMRQPEPQQDLRPQQPESGMMMGGGPMRSPMEDNGGPGSSASNMDTAARVLSLAQQTADQAIADARREADETLNRARREADDVLTKARRQADQITGDARARAESLERDAQERHRQAMGSLVQQREELERRVDDLRAFEREYRSRLKAYLEGQLRDLEAGVTDSGTFPAIPSTPQSSSAPQLPAGVGQPAIRGGGNSSSSAGSASTPAPTASQYAIPEHAGGYRPGDR